MSISRFREIMEHSGCRVVLAIMFSLIAAAFVLNFKGCNAAGPNGQDATQAEAPIATIGDINVTRSQVETQSERSQTGATGPLELAQQKGLALDNAVTRALDTVVAKQNNITITDQDVLDLVNKQFDEQMIMAKMQMEMSKKLPQNATDKQFEDAFKVMSHGKTPAQSKQAQLDEFKKELEDPQQKQQLYALAVDPKLMEALKAKASVTDEDLKHLSDTYFTKRIFIDAKKHPNEEASKKLQGVLADIKAKKLTFEQAMNQYTDDTPGKGKKPEENVYQPDYKTMKVNPEFTPILSLKPGEMTDVVPSAGGAAIYRLDRIESKPDPNFEKVKDTLRKDFVEPLAATELNKQQDAARAQIKWLSPGYGVLYEWYQMQKPEFQRKPLPDQKVAQQNLLKKALDAAKTDQRGGDQAAWLTAFALFDPTWTAASAEEKKKLAEQRAEIIHGVLSTNENVDLRLKLVDMDLERKDGTNAAADLEAAATANSTDFALTGQQHFRDIAGKLDTLKNLKLMPPDKEKAIQTALDNWRQGKKEYEQQLADQKKREEEDRKKAAEEQKKIDEEAKKKAAAEKANAPKSAPVPSPNGGKPGSPVAPQINLQPGGTATIPGPTAPTIPQKTTAGAPPKGK